MSNYSDEEVVAAVERLYKSFAGRRFDVAQAIEDFAPYRSQAAIGVDFLVERLSAPDLRQREAAAWALGRIGQAAAPAIETLIEKLQTDPRNRYCSVVLERDLPLSPLQVDQICDALERGSVDVDAKHECLRIVGHRLSADRVHRWVSHHDSLLRSRAISCCRDRTVLLSALGDRSEQVAQAAAGVLADPELKTGEWYFSDLTALTPDQAYAIAAAFQQNRTDLSGYREQLFDCLMNHEDMNLVMDLLACVKHFSDKTLEDLDTILKITCFEEPVAFRCEKIEVIRSFHDCGFDDEVTAKLAEFLGDENVFVRALAIEKIGFFQSDTPALTDSLQRGLEDESSMVQLKALWHLYFQGDEHLPFLQQQLTKSTHDQVTAELVCVIKMLGGTVDRDAIENIESMPLTSSALQWADAQIS